MRTLGIDLASAARKTAACVVTWGRGEAVVQQPKLGASDRDLVPLLVEADWAGIDAPFGWPDAMVLAIHRYATEGEWIPIDRSEFRYRHTDRFAEAYVGAKAERSISPMSVAADKIAMLAWRVAHLREAYAERAGSRFDRTGRDCIVEVYPAAALVLWGLDNKGYKASRNPEKRVSEAKAREALVESIEAEAPWLRWEGSAKATCAGSDDALDAFLAALIARAAALGLTAWPEQAVAEQTSSEGWIHLPDPGCVSQLVDAKVRSG